MPFDYIVARVLDSYRDVSDWRRIVAELTARLPPDPAVIAAAVDAFDDATTAYNVALAALVQRPPYVAPGAALDEPPP